MYIRNYVELTYLNTRSVQARMYIIIYHSGRTATDKSVCEVASTGNETIIVRCDRNYCVRLVECDEIMAWD